MNEDMNGQVLIQGDRVIVIGTITNLEQVDGKSVITIAVDKEGSLLSMDFYSEELIKGTISHTINGNVPDPTEN